MRVSLEDNDLSFVYNLLTLIDFREGISFNQPKFCPSATWNATGITFATNSSLGSYPYGMFISMNNTVYVANQEYDRIQVWFEGNSIPTTITTANNYLYALFVTITGDIYNSNINNIEKRTLNSPGTVSTLYSNGTCWDLFIDSNNSLYCSLAGYHQVIKRSLNSSDNQTTTVAGTGCPGFLQDKLYYPYGIFVDINFNLYVADQCNHRIQLFPPGQLNATTIAGNRAPGTITLRYPTDVILDADSYLFIVDNNNHRVVGSGSAGFRCIVGCSGTCGSTSNQLCVPWTMAFDSDGNIFVVDRSNHRVQKFLLATNSCGEYFFMLMRNEQQVRIRIILQTSSVQYLKVHRFQVIHMTIFFSHHV